MLSGYQPEATQQHSILLFLILNGSSLIMRKMGHIDIFELLKTETPSIFKANDKLCSLSLTGLLKTGPPFCESLWYILLSYTSSIFFSFLLYPLMAMFQAVFEVFVGKPIFSWFLIGSSEKYPFGVCASQIFQA